MTKEKERGGQGGEGSKGSAGHSFSCRGLAGAARQGRGRQGGGAAELLVAKELGHELLFDEDDGEAVASGSEEDRRESRLPVRR